MFDIVSRWTPEGGRFTDPNQLQLVQDLLSWDSLRDSAPFVVQAPAEAFTPQFEVKETKEAFIFKADLPGVDGKNLDVSLTGNLLQVSGLRNQEDCQKGETFFAHERAFGDFSRTFTLPEGINREEVKAALKDGVLTLLVPKTPEQQPKKILIQ
jgi:HSP20 family protein